MKPIVEKLADLILGFYNISKEEYDIRLYSTDSTIQMDYIYPFTLSITYNPSIKDDPEKYLSENKRKRILKSRQNEMDKFTQFLKNKCFY